jgi:hypothetical protein
MENQDPEIEVEISVDSPPSARIEVVDTPVADVWREPWE